MFKNIFVLSILCACGGLATAIKVSVYYETLCADTINFFRNQFAPAYDVIGDDLEIDLVPFGKATAENVSGVWNFTCQHGERECHGNKIHSCVVELFPEHSTQFVICAFNTSDASLDLNLETCSNQTNVTWSTIQECLNSGQADELLAANGNRTHSVEPEITFVPTIIYNDIFRESLQALSLANFLPTGHFLAEQHECGGCHFTNGANKVTNTHVFVLSLLVLLISRKIFSKELL